MCGFVTRRALILLAAGKHVEAVLVILAARLENKGNDATASLFWDVGNCPDMGLPECWNGLRVWQDIVHSRLIDADWLAGPGNFSKLFFEQNESFDFSQ